MKTVKSSQFFRMVALVLIEVVLGAALGVLFGEDILLKEAHTEVRDLAARIVVNNEAFIKESDSVFDAVNHSPHARHEACSEADIAFMDGLLLETHFLKDIGRIRNNAFICTALLNRIPVPVPIATPPNVVSSDGHRFYRKTPNLIGTSEESAILFQEAGILTDNANFFNAQDGSIRSSAFTTNSKAGSAVLIYGNAITLPAADILSQRAGQFQGSTYASICSTRYPVCAVASIPGDELVKHHQSLLWASGLFGAIFGVLIALIAVLFFRSRGTLLRQLQNAVRRGDLKVVYQPIIELSSGRTVGAEALVRWTLADGESISPDIFIPIAERAGFIGDITRLVIRRTAAELSPLLHQFPGLHVAINFAAPDLTDPAVLQELDRCVGLLQLSPSCIVVELTERITTDRRVAHEGISALRRRGHEVYIDDFGTGYSSLAYLSELNIDGMKLDRAFTATVGTEAVTAAIVPQILAMAYALNLAVVVEGIETEAQHQYFCDIKRPTPARPMLAQGWFFSAPLAARDFTDRVTTERERETVLLQEMAHIKAK
jgi:sensor c-di-GMP phosphodiesterase-like protein